MELIFAGTAKPIEMPKTINYIEIIINFWCHYYIHLIVSEEKVIGVGSAVGEAIATINLSFILSKCLK
jgi:hypothetical protein